MSPTQQLLETMATEPDLPTVLQKCRLTLEEAYALLNSQEGRRLRQIVRNTARIHCEQIAHRNAPKALHQLTTVATTITDGAAKPEVQLKSIHALLRALNLDNLPIKHSHHALPKPKPPAPPALPPPLPPPHVLIVKQALQEATQKITALNIAQNADPPPRHLSSDHR